MPNGGYVWQNGIALCAPCHEKAEVVHSTGTALPGFAPSDFRFLGWAAMIRSSEALARQASLALVV